MSLSSDPGSDLIRRESLGGSIRSRTSVEGSAEPSAEVRDNVGEDAMRDVQMNMSVEHGSGREASTQESMEDTQSSKEKAKSAGVKKMVTQQKRVIVSDPRPYAFTAVDRTGQ